MWMSRLSSHSFIWSQWQAFTAWSWGMTAPLKQSRLLILRHAHWIPETCACALVWSRWPPLSSWPLLLGRWCQCPGHGACFGSVLIWWKCNDLTVTKLEDHWRCSEFLLLFEGFITLRLKCFHTRSFKIISLEETSSRYATVNHGLVSSCFLVAVSHLKVIEFSRFRNPPPSINFKGA